MTKIKNLSQASPEQMRSLQKKELEILKYLKKICEENELKFFLGGGSCIGTLRHQGFIPWDDDVDVFMLRDDYERLYKDWNKYSQNKKYSLCRSDETHNYRHAAMTINDNDTTFINFRTQDEDVNQGIAVDIIPIDYLANGFWQRCWQRWNAIIFSIFINQRLPDNQGKVLRLLTELPLAIIRAPQKRYKVWKRAEKRMIKYSSKNGNQAVELVTGLKAIMRPLKPEWFENVRYEKFEDTEMPIAVGAEKYLTLIFGDYMKMPPVESRLAKHHTALIDTEKSFTDYKGKYYLVRK
ncbi:LicD family protein [Secundilactobacillus similis]|uniref:LicD3 protein n=1 Tax=Secundilactobacillus similis DSM 23365 = JCM 2765 TaxID=1423804 RepID=A0A0R2EZD7_9LACO|nr:LicD family protein [Secundilactobacillus similis]KRN21395.1 licD3 protein [Secundilactobacillus similis DSM 23365 = JCM 2765]